jgi:hypothetical protein
VLAAEPAEREGGAGDVPDEALSGSDVTSLGRDARMDLESEVPSDPTSMSSFGSLVPARGLAPDVLLPDSSELVEELVCEVGVCGVDGAAPEVTGALYACSESLGDLLDVVLGRDGRIDEAEVVLVVDEAAVGDQGVDVEKAAKIGGEVLYEGDDADLALGLAGAPSEVVLEDLREVGEDAGEQLRAPGEEPGQRLGKGDHPLAETLVR